MKIELEELKVVNLKPDDTIVLKTKINLSRERHNAMLKELKRFFPNHNVIILHEDFDLEVYRKKPTPPESRILPESKA